MSHSPLVGRRRHGVDGGYHLGGRELVQGVPDGEAAVPQRQGPVENLQKL